MPRKKQTLDAKPIEQYTHGDKERVNNPPVGLVTPETDKEAGKQTYAYDPHLDPQLVWAGKAEHTSFEVPTVSLHVHERIDPRTIIESVRRRHEEESGFQNSLFASEQVQLPLFKAVEFYKHRHNWANRLVAGDSLLVMNSLLVKEGMAGSVQMVYFDPPYGIKYGSNFQPFVNKRDVKDGRDEDLTAEPETLKAFRDTWELGIHSYLTYLRDRLLLARELLHESGSIFVQISDENVHLVRSLLDEVFGTKNFCALIAVQKTSARSAELLAGIVDYIIWYSKDKNNVRFRSVYTRREASGEVLNQYRWIELADGERRQLRKDEIENPKLLPDKARLFRPVLLTSSHDYSLGKEPFEFEGKTYLPGTRYWSTSPTGLANLAKAKRLFPTGNTLNFLRYFDDFAFAPLADIWTDTATGGGSDRYYVVQTTTKVLQRCILMTTDPGDLVLDITCGSGTTAYVAEQWGRRWITCDTSRVALALTRQRLMTATFDYYQLASQPEGIASGFKYKTVPHVTLKSIANNEPPAQETLYDQPLVEKNTARVTSPFTVEAVPAPVVAPLQAVDSGQWTVDSEGKKALATDHYLPATNDIARSGETLRQDEWRSELLRTGIRGRRGERMLFSRVEPLAGTRFLHADAELVVSEQGLVDSKEADAEGGESLTTNHKSLTTNHAARAVVSFGPEHEPMPPTQVELALMEANKLFPKPKFVIFAAFQFDPVAVNNIEQTNWQGVQLLKAQMNADLLTEDLKKSRASNESFWLIGQPDVRVVSGQWLVDSKNNVVANYELYQKLSGLGGVAEINALKQKDLLFYAALSERGDLWLDLAVAAGLRLDPGEHRGGTSAQQHGGIQTIFGHRQRLDGGSRNLADAIGEYELPDKGRFRRFIEGLRGSHEIAQRIAQVTQNLKTIHRPLTTIHFYQVEVLGFDYYNVKDGVVESGGANRIAVWMLDTNFDGRSLFPQQVFFPMAGEKDGWARLARDLKSEINEDLIEAYRGNVSLPFAAGSYKRIAVKIVDDRGIESLKLIDVV